MQLTGDFIVDTAILEAQQQNYAHTHYRYNLRRRYKIEWVEYYNLLAAQDFKCAVCDKEWTLNSKLVVDHNHDTSEIRGLLCLTCNNGIGMLGDSPERLGRAAQYLRRVGHYGT